MVDENKQGGETRAASDKCVRMLEILGHANADFRPLTRRSLAHDCKPSGRR